MAKLIQASLVSVLLSTSLYAPLSYAQVTSQVDSIAKTKQDEPASITLQATPSVIKQAPQRIISLSPSTTELIYSLGVEDRLLAVSRFSNYPPEAASKPIIGDAFSVNTEQLVSLQPDLIVAWDSEPFSNSLKHLPNTKVWDSHPNSIEGLFDDIQALADIVNSPKQAEILQLKQTIHALAQKYRPHEIPFNSSGAEHSPQQDASHAIPTVPSISARPLQGMLLISQQPLYVLTRESIQSDALSICNAHNIFSSIFQGAAIVNRETILMNPPDFVVYSYSTEKERELHERFIVQTLGLSLNKKQLIGIDSDTWSRPTVRFLQALPGLCERIAASRQN
ncbi:MAG: ABC transporter substrate-binding protein [Pelistega sp.]|nr:ABC transporter substrate-binding protein [Pelistega sp.]